MVGRCGVMGVVWREEVIGGGCKADVVGRK